VNAVHEAISRVVAVYGEMLAQHERVASLQNAEIARLKGEVDQCHALLKKERDRAEGR